MARWFRPVNHDQGCLLPADIRSWLPPDHLAWQVIAVTGELDLSRFAAAYRADGQGQAPYDPAMMAGLLLYCYFKGIRSSRKITRQPRSSMHASRILREDRIPLKKQ